MKVVCAGLCFWFALLPAHAGLLDALHVRAKVDVPREADQPGYEVVLIDSHSDSTLVSVGIAVPDSFGKVDVAALDIMDDDGRKIGNFALVPGAALGKKTAYDFNLRRECLKNSTFTLAHYTSDGLDAAVVHLGTFDVRDSQVKASPTPVRLALAEQGVYGESEEEFTVTDRVPYEEGVRFGVRLLLRGNGRSLPLRVEQTLPDPPKTWGDAETLARLTISADGRTSSQTQTVATNELLHPGWTIAEGDPEGDWQIKIFVRDELVKSFVFHVRREAAPSASPSP